MVPVSVSTTSPNLQVQTCRSMGGGHRSCNHPGWGCAGTEGVAASTIRIGMRITTEEPGISSAFFTVVASCAGLRVRTPASRSVDLRAVQLHEGGNDFNITQVGTLRRVEGSATRAVLRPHRLGHQVLAPRT